MRAEAIAKIQALYDSGLPLFTKSSLRDAYQQIKESNEKRKKISLKGLDGVSVDFDVETGDVRQNETVPDPSLQFLVQKPLIGYRPIQLLTTHTCEIEAPTAYCPLVIYHDMKLQDKLTEEILGSLPAQPREEVEAFFRSKLRAWESSEACKQLRSTLTKRRNILREVRKIVGFACGDITLDYLDSNYPPRSSVQHALLLTVQDILMKEKGNGNMITCYSQDPAYTDVDRSILKEHGITTVHDPEGFLMVDDSTAVFSCSPDVPVRQIISDLARPVIMIWSKVRMADGPDLIDGMIPADPSSSRLREMIQNSYDEFEFPKDENFVKMAIYIRREDVETDISGH